MFVPGASTASPGSPQANRPAETVQEAAEQSDGGEEGRAVGHVRWQVYTAYMKAVGAGMVALVLLSLTLMQASIPSRCSCCLGRAAKHVPFKTRDNSLT